MGTPPVSASRREKVPVIVHAADPISYRGTTSQLRDHPGVYLVEEASTPPGTVAILLAEPLDDATLARLRKLSRTGGRRVVLVTSGLREPELPQVLASGVKAIVWRQHATAHRLSRAVLAVARGDGDMPSDLQGRLVQQMAALQSGLADGVAVRPSGLTAREVDILRLMAGGMDTREVAAALSFSERTVKKTVHDLTSRLHLRNRTHAVAYALREGYI